jgi:hypothetical protein
MILVVCKYAQMHHNTFLTTPKVKKITFLRTWFWWSESMRKHVFNHSRHLRKSFLGTWFWWCVNPSKHVFHNSRRHKKIFFSGHDSGGLEVCENASKHLFHRSRLQKNFFFRTCVSLHLCVLPDHQNHARKFFFYVSNGETRFDAFSHTSRPPETSPKKDILFVLMHFLTTRIKSLKNYF